LAFAKRRILRWMMMKAGSHGLFFRSEVDLDGDNVTAAKADADA
jgi:hypothetical protein